MEEQYFRWRGGPRRRFFLELGGVAGGMCIGGARGGRGRCCPIPCYRVGRAWRGVAVVGIAVACGENEPNPMVLFELTIARLWGVVALLTLMAGVGFAPPGALVPVVPPETKGEVGGEVGGDEPDESEAELVLKDGRQLSGAVIERTPDHVILRINGVATAFPAEDVRSIDEKPPVSQRYREMRAAIDDSDIEQRIRLVEWLRGRKKYTLALNEVTGVLSREPDNPDGLRLQTWLNEQMKLRRALQAKKNPGKSAEAGKEAAFPLLSPAEVNLIRVYEVELGDPPRMLVEPETVKKMIEDYASSPLIPPTNAGREGLYRKRPAQILELMFKLQARELYGQVQVQEDPPAMKLFRERVYSTWLMNSCGTSQCHGGDEAGRLWLTTRRPNTDAAVYTNFLILERFRLLGIGGGEKGADGKAGGKGTEGKGVGAQGVKGGVPLIDYEDPAKSPLLHLGLPRTRSLFPHPEVGGRAGQRGYSPVFQSVEDRRFEDAVAWIRAMYRPRANYPIEYTPPVRAAESGAGKDAGSGPGPSVREEPKQR